MPKANILIADENKEFCERLNKLLRAQGHDASYVSTARDLLKKTKTDIFDVVMLSTRMPDGDGIDLIPQIMELPAKPEVISLTDFGHPDEAERVIKNGAWEYVVKASSQQKLMRSIAGILRYRTKMLQNKTSDNLDYADSEEIVGKSPLLKSCLNLAFQAAGCEANVLIGGETGTGKELFARAIHNNSCRAAKNFVVVDCGTLPETLVESILFGHEKGAFTGAERAQTGLIYQADKGTLFLDEIGELPLTTQKAFLRVLEERNFRPIGSKQELKSDFRLIAATNQDLDNLVRQGKFRKDLLFRLRSFFIHLPPLRDRSSDIRLLALYYMRRLCEDYGLEEKKFATDFLETLSKYDWPGNVRELYHAIDRACAAAGQASILFAKHLPTHIRVQIARSAVGKGAQPSNRRRKNDVDAGPLPRIQDMREAIISEAEKQYLNDLIGITKGNIQEACTISGLSRSRLYALFKHYGISASYK